LGGEEQVGDQVQRAGEGQGDGARPGDRLPVALVDQQVLVAFAEAQAVVGGGASSRTSATAVLTSVA
jgi:hypothetical protein